MTSTDEKGVTEITEGVEQVILGEDGKPLSKKAIKKMLEKQEKEKKKLARQMELEKEKKEKESQDFARERYGENEMIQSKSRTDKKWLKIEDLKEESEGERVLLRGRLHLCRATGKNAFLVLRQSYSTIQVVFTANETTVSKGMIKFVGGIPKESIVDIEGTIAKPLSPVESCTQKNIEISGDKVFIISKMKCEKLPFEIDDAARPESQFETEDQKFSKVYLETRLNNRIVDLRTSTNLAIFKLQAGVTALFREFLTQREFIEIHSPKLISAASEGGANVFKVSYFNTFAYLAQSPQLYKQMAITSDFGRVFEIAPAENANTHRHLTEFMGLDLEMAFNEHYHEVMYLIADMFNYIFKNLVTRFRKELDTVQAQYPFPEFEFLEKPLILEYKEAVEILRSNGVSIGDYDDLDTPTEKLLGKLIKDKYKTDFYVLDKFPLAVRPFYTMPDPVNPNYSNAYDFFIRGQEILSGAQRIHDPDFLKEKAIEHAIDLSTIDSYLKSFELAAPPHAGGGIGLERVVMLYLNLTDIRQTSLFPRDPKRLTP